MTGHLGVSLYSRLFLLFAGMGLAAWSFSKLRDRHLFISVTAFFVFLGIALVLFAAFPMPFDRLSFVLGIHYPPILYLILAVLLLMAVVIHLATQLANVEKRCMRLTQELAIQIARLEVVRVSMQPARDPEHNAG